MDETLKRNEILRSRRDVTDVRRRGRRVNGPRLYLRFCARPEPAPTDTPALPPRRVAFLLPRGIRTAVRRNRLKRRLREAYRRNKDWFPSGRDYLVHATVAAADLDFDELARDLKALAEGVRSAR